MFIKIVIVLLLLIVAASLLGNRMPGRAATPSPRLRPLIVRVALILLALSALAVAFHLSGCSRNEDGFHATTIRAADFGRLSMLENLTDHTGRRPAIAEFSGKVVVVFFGYTRCPDICPTTLAGMKEVLQLLGTDADRVQVLFVTLDPERDTQDVLAGYVPWFDPRFIGLRGDMAATLATAQEFQVFFSKVPGSTPDNYSIDHSATSYAYDPQGRLRLLIRHGTTPAHIAADLKRLLAGE